MPELPEVETIVRDLQRMVPGATISRAEVLKPDLLDAEANEFEAALRDRTILSVSRRAKNIVIDLGDPLLIINLGMTGRVLVLPEGVVEPGYVGVRFHFVDGRRMLYQDVRRFGSLRVQPVGEWRARADGLGVEPLSPEFTADLVFKLSRNARIAVKPWLMDQKRIVGVGNIYASESLFRAGISPRRAARRLSRKQATALREAVRAVLQESIDFRGTTLLDYRDANGEPGAFVRQLRVYDRAGEPCTTCGVPIRRVVQSGRSTFYCPRCQK